MRPLYRCAVRLSAGYAMAHSVFSLAYSVLSFGLSAAHYGRHRSAKRQVGEHESAQIMDRVNAWYGHNQYIRQLSSFNCVGRWANLGVSAEQVINHKPMLPSAF